LAIAQDISGKLVRGRNPADRRAVALWLFVCCAMIFAMVILGGVTRLTESGLSITEWQPIGGAIPPLGHADWQALFDQYRASPQYREINQGMDLAGFQSIFWWEYVHRLWGRLIGFVFLLPLIWFAVTGRITRRMILPLSSFFLLGGVQGAIGWWMVASGLDSGPFVSPYRLTFHLGFALALYGAMLWVALDMWRPPAPAAPGTMRVTSLFLVALVFVTVLAGGFVAGAHAGLIYNEFPMMGDGLIPFDYRNATLSWIRNAFENPAAIQLHHRILAITTLCASLGFSAWVATRAPWARVEAALLAAMVVVQVALGITTLLLQVPLTIAALHQAGAATLLTLAIVLAQRLYRRGEAIAPTL
jgi:cytochrome c oxidase assembly protein subunit 15